jgi:hypothetical protein
LSLVVTNCSFLRLKKHQQWAADNNTVVSIMFIGSDKLRSFQDVSGFVLEKSRKLIYCTNTVLY